MRRLMAAGVLVLAAGWAAAADDAAAAAKKLEGTYEVVEATRGGKPEPKGKEITAFVIKDGTLSIEGEKRRADTARFTLDPSKKPAHIDIKPGPGDIVVKGIYETKETDKGLELTIAFPAGSKAGDERPKDFKGAEESVVVLKLLRKKEK
jgi:uncharacterized protein (TIGR03067 family)